VGHLIVGISTTPVDSLIRKKMLMVMLNSGHQYAIATMHESVTTSHALVARTPPSKFIVHQCRLPIFETRQLETIRSWLCADMNIETFS
jgi:hypothetical protein